MRRSAVVVAAMALLMAAGCRSKAAPPVPVRAVYEGPLLSVEEVVGSLSERAAAVRTVWARHDYVVSLLEQRRGGEARVRTFDGDGVLLLRKPPLGSAVGTPIELRIQGSKDVLGTVFDVGANRERAWLILFADIDTMYWTVQSADPFEGGGEEEGDGVRVPARPELLAEVLGVSDWPTDLTRYPTPVMRYEAGEDAYVLTLVEPSGMGTHLVSRREYWVDRGSLEIRRVVLRGWDGREAVRAELAGHAGIGEGVGGGRMARDVTIMFPASGTTIRLTLRAVAERRGALPGDVSFRFPEPPPVSKVIRVR